MTNHIIEMKEACIQIDGSMSHKLNKSFLPIFEEKLSTMFVFNDDIKGVQSDLEDKKSRFDMMLGDL